MLFRSHTTAPSTITSGALRNSLTQIQEVSIPIRSRNANQNTIKKTCLYIEVEIFRKSEREQTQPHSPNQNQKPAIRMKRFFPRGVETSPATPSFSIFSGLLRAFWRLSFSLGLFCGLCQASDGSDAFMAVARNNGVCLTINSSFGRTGSST